MSLPLLAAALASVAFVISSSARAEEAYRLSGPYEHDNLAIYLIHGKSADGPVPLTLEEALAKGTVTVHETGNVVELEIENTGDEEVLVHAGDIVKGGRQDRVLNLTLIVPPKSGRVPLSAFCVESGRWAARGGESAAAFSSAKELFPSREAKLAMKAAKARPAPDTAGVERGAAARRMAPAADAQSEVWRNVSRIQEALKGSLGAKVSSEDSETSLQLALENARLVSAQKEHMDALEKVGTEHDDVLGYVFAINGKVNSADVYASNALFRKMWPRLLKASVTEAIASEKVLPKDLAPSLKKVEAFLTDSAATKAEARPLTQGLRLETREASAALDFETRRTSGELVHRNVLAR